VERIKLNGHILVGSARPILELRIALVFSFCKPALQIEDAQVCGILVQTIARRVAVEVRVIRHNEGKMCKKTSRA